MRMSDKEADRVAYQVYGDWLLKADVEERKARREIVKRIYEIATTGSRQVKALRNRIADLEHQLECVKEAIK